MEQFLVYFNLGAAFFILIAMALMIARLITGPTLYDRLLAVNAFGTFRSMVVLNVVSSQRQ